MGRMFPGQFGRNTCVPGAAETPATWVIPGGDSAPTKMATHLGDSRSEAEHHRSLWAELCSVKAESPAQGRSLRSAHNSTMLASRRCWTELNRKFWAELLFHMPRAETPVLKGGDSAPRNICFEELRAEVPDW